MSNGTEVDLFSKVLSSRVFRNDAILRHTDHHEGSCPAPCGKDNDGRIGKFRLRAVPKQMFWFTGITKR